MLKKAKIDLELDFLGDVQNWVCYDQVLSSPLRIGIPFVDLIHPLYKNNFIYELQKVNTTRHQINFNLSLNEIGYFTPAIALVVREEYKYLMSLELKNMINQEVLLSKVNPNLSGKDNLADITDIVFSSIIGLLDDSSYLIVRKLPQAYICSQKGKALMIAFVSLFIEMKDVDSTDKFVLEGKIVSGELLIILKKNTSIDADVLRQLFFQLNAKVKFLLEDLGGRLLVGSTGVFTLCLPI